MTETSVQDPPSVDVPAPIAAPRVEHDLVWGRPVEDRGFETVEAAGGFAVGLAIGAIVAGPLGAAVGAVAGAAGGFMAGEALERKVGRVATTTDATGPETPEADEAEPVPATIDA